MKVLNIDHVGIAVRSIEETLEFYQKILWIELEGIEIIEDQKVKVAFLPVGDTKIELLESIDVDDPIARYIHKRGEGMQHIAFRVPNIEEAIGELLEKGVKMIDKKPRYGAGGAQIAFCHPNSTNGVLVELSQK